MFDKIEVLKDPKQDIQFWLDALSNPNVNMETVKLLNTCLCSELKNYLYPTYKIKTDPMPIDNIEPLKKGTLVILKNDETKTPRKILFSIVDDNGIRDRYSVEGCKFVCNLRDLIIVEDQEIE